VKFIKQLTKEERITLKELMANGKNERIRMRAHSILLNDKKLPIEQISYIYDVHRNTVSMWLDSWETSGIIGLFDDSRSGRPKLLTKEEEQNLLKYIEEEPRNIKKVTSKIKKETGKSPSLDTIKRAAKAAGLVWKRVRKSLKGKRDEVAFKLAKQEIEELRKLKENGELELLFFDESGFTLEPVVPYAWQPKGEVIEIPSAKSKRLNVLGFMNYNCSVESYIFEGTISTQEVIGCFDAISEKLTIPTWIVLDNASIHTSALFKAQISRWEKKNLFIKNIPAYSPELNLIEILWKHIKYYWLPFNAYESFASLKKHLDDIMANIGYKYKITFA
jgi:transposase